MAKMAVSGFDLLRLARPSQNVGYHRYESILTDFVDTMPVQMITVNG
jgi:hypothetical protein